MERWAAVEIMGHRRHVGRISEEALAGVMLLRVDALQRDGSFEVVRYGGQAIFGVREVTEERAREEVMQEDVWGACETFREPSAIEGRCSGCGHTLERHERRKRPALPAPRPAAEEGDEEEAPDSEPGEVIGARKRIETVEDFVEALGDAIEGGEFAGVLGLDDLETRVNGDRLLAVLLNDDKQTQLRLVVGCAPADEPATDAAPDSGVPWEEKRAEEVPHG